MKQNKREYRKQYSVNQFAIQSYGFLNYHVIANIKKKLQTRCQS